MFNDIMSESSIMNDVIITEASERLIHTIHQISKDFMTEVSNISKMNTFKSLLEEAQTNQRESFFRRLLRAFKEFITKIIQWFSEKLHIADMRLSILVKKLNKISYINKIVITAPKNLYKIGMIYRTIIKKAGDELMSPDISEFITLAMSDKDISGINDLIKLKYSGYVPTLSGYDDHKVEDIKEDIFGSMQEVQNLNPDKLYATLTELKDYRTELQNFEKSYNKTVTALQQRATTISDDTVTKILNSITAYTNKNITLISGLVGESIGIIIKAFMDLNSKVKEYKTDN